MQLNVTLPEHKLILVLDEILEGMGGEESVRLRSRLTSDPKFLKGALEATSNGISFSVASNATGREFYPDLPEDPDLGEIYRVVRAANDGMLINFLG